MLEVVQVGQVGKTNLLLDMHRLRKRVFYDRMGWEVRITPGGLEVDDFDLPETIYLLCLDDNKRVIGNWRLLPTIGPYMIRSVWPQFLESINIPEGPDVWEASRFSVDSLKENCDEGLAQVNQATQELFCGLTELCLLSGIREICTMYDMRVARLLKRLDCSPHTISQRRRISDTICEVGIFRTDDTMLSKLRKASGISEQLILKEQLPGVLRTSLRTSPLLKAEHQRPSNYNSSMEDKYETV